jgi:hypothetical protein
MKYESIPSICRLERCIGSKQFDSEAQADLLLDLPSAASLPRIKAIEVKIR